MAGPRPVLARDPESPSVNQIPLVFYSIFRVIAPAYPPTSRGKGTRAAGDNFGSVLGTVRVKVSEVRAR